MIGPSVVPVEYEIDRNMNKWKFFSSDVCSQGGYGLRSSFASYS